MCDEQFPTARWDIGYRICLDCGETLANRTVRTVVPMHKSNYFQQQRRAGEMKIKTNELTGAALDWAVAKAEGWEGADLASYLFWSRMVKYSTNWSQGGPIIEREGMSVERYNHPDFNPWVVTKVIGWEKREDGEMGDWPVEAQGGGDTLLIAAMRCYVASRLGDEVEIPEELK
jgi:Protein of unknown function (DUF2591)